MVRKLGNITAVATTLKRKIRLITDLLIGTLERLGLSMVVRQHLKSACSCSTRLEGRNVPKHSLKGREVVVDGVVVLGNVNKGRAQLPEAIMIDSIKKHKLGAFSAFVVHA